jgi:hypothetical protein
LGESKKDWDSEIVPLFVCDNLGEGEDSEISDAFEEVRLKAFKLKLLPLDVSKSSANCVKLFPCVKTRSLKGLQKYKICITAFA